MKRKDIDWSIIRGSLIGLLLSISIGSSMVVGSYYFRNAMNREFRLHNSQFMNISQRYLAIDEEEKRIRTYLPKFIELYHKGTLGQEQRLNWIEALKEAQSTIKLPNYGYNINSQRVFTPGFPVDLGKFRLYVSEMSLQLSLLHEGDLLNLFEHLDEHANGTYSIDSCNFTRSGSIVMDNPKAANIMADCHLDWYTIKLADGSDIQV